MWNEVIRPLRDDAIFWHWLWEEANRPPTGVIACIMRATRAKYHKAIKTNRDQQTKLRRNKLAQYCAENKYRQLWSEINKIDKNNQCTPQSVDGHSESVEIAEVFARRYKDLYSSVPTDAAELNEIRGNIERKLSDLTQSSIPVITVG